MRKLFVTIAAKMNTSTKEFLAEGLCGMDLAAIAEKALLIYFSLPPELKQKAYEFAATVPEDVGDSAVKLLNYFQALKDMSSAKKRRDDVEPTSGKKRFDDVETVMNVDDVEPTSGKKRRDDVKTVMDVDDVEPTSGKKRRDDVKTVMDVDDVEPSSVKKQRGV